MSLDEATARMAFLGPRRLLRRRINLDPDGNVLVAEPDGGAVLRLYAPTN